MDGAHRVRAISGIEFITADLQAGLPAFFLARISLGSQLITYFAPISRTLNQYCALTWLLNLNCTIKVHTLERSYGADSDWPS